MISDYTACSYISAWEPLDKRIKQRAFHCALENYMIIDFEKHKRETGAEPKQYLAEGDAGTDVKSHKDGAFVIGDV